MEMEGYNTAFALFGTKYGSVNTTFKTKNDADFVTVPEGIAHFLEHKLFENEDCDVFELYAKTERAETPIPHSEEPRIFSAVQRISPSLFQYFSTLFRAVFYAGDSRQGAGHNRSGDKDGEDNPYVAVFFIF